MDNYKGSQFNLFIPLDKPAEECLIFNTLTGSEVVVDKHLKAIIEKTEPPQALCDQSNLRELKELGIIVDESIDEDLELEYWFQRIKFDTSALDITILPTLACNLKCSYCFQEGLQSNAFMNQDTCNLVIAWIEKNMEDIRPRKLRLMYYGGEPLLNMEAINYLSQNLHRAAMAREVKIDIDIITNGVLLSPQMVDFLLPLGLSGIKITLDGDEEAHNLKRPFKNGQGTFQKIFQNLIQIYGRVPICLGGNFDEQNKKSIPRLLDRLATAGLKEGQVQFKPIFSKLACRKSNACEICTFSESRPQDMLWLRHEVEKRGFTPNNGIALGPCTALRQHSYTIDPHGRIYKCGGLVGVDKFVIGDIHSQSFNYHMTEFMTVDLWKKCRACPYIPLCGGGCRASAFMKGGDFRQPACEKRYFEQVAIPILKEEYLRNSEEVT